ncbi:MAG: ribosome assembly RNA-binding protein YhbY [Neisseriaceae bacterium]|nr:ribosome assembly RNA-binding protein YhbY [Neisseriaceae bacterium]
MQQTLTSQERQLLKQKAHHLNPVVMIGQNGLTPAVLHEIDTMLHAHELIKIRILGDDREERTQMATEITQALSAHLVSHIGKLLIVYRKRKTEKK